ncbi:hypothetical protein ACOSQ3_028976 [Xanthoceras sorbifolium]
MLANSRPMKVIADARRFSIKGGPRRCLQVLGQIRSSRMLVGFRPTKVLVDAYRFSTNEGPNQCLQVLDQRRSSRMLAGSQANEVLMDARKFSTNEGSRPKNVLGGYRPMKVLANIHRFSAKEDPSRCSQVLGQRRVGSLVLGQKSFHDHVNGFVREKLSSRGRLRVVGESGRREWLPWSAKSRWSSKKGTYIRFLKGKS